MDPWADGSIWREHREELLREAQRWRLGREAREGRWVSARPKKVSAAVKVRWGLGDEPGIAELLELNGVPRWVAFEERFAVAERDGAVVAVVRCRTEPERLLLGLLVVDPWSEEQTLATALYAGARSLALKIGASVVVVRSDRHRAADLREAGYHRLGDVWRADPSRSVERREEPPGVGRLRRIGRAAFFLRDLLFHR
jgi:hypothetical protein